MTNKKNSKRSKKSACSKRKSSKKKTAGSITKHEIKNPEYHKKIVKYLDKFHKSLEEKKLFGFWAFPDKKPFTKITKTRNEIKKIVKNNDKYHNRQIANISIVFKQKNDAPSFRELGIYITATINIYYIDNNGNMDPKWDTTISWHEDDFEVSRPSLKLLEQIMYLTADEIITTIGFFGSPLRVIMHRLKQKNIDISEVLNPIKS